MRRAVILLLSGIILVVGGIYLITRGGDHDPTVGPTPRATRADAGDQGTRG